MEGHAWRLCCSHVSNRCITPVIRLCKPSVNGNQAFVDGNEDLMFRLKAAEHDRNHPHDSFSSAFIGNNSSNIIIRLKLKGFFY